MTYSAGSPQINTSKNRYSVMTMMVCSLHDNIDDEVANILANGIIRNAPLKELNIRGATDISHIGWLEIFSALQMNPKCRLEKLILYLAHINEAAALSLSNVILRHTATLKTLRLSDSIEYITIAGWGALFHPLLQNPNSVLEKLDLSLSATNITDEVATALTIALANNSRLRKLDLSSNHDVTATGWVGFSVVLRNPNTALEILDLQDNDLNDQVITYFADALVNNNMLRDLNLNGTNVSYDGYAAFTHTLCNNASILITYHSNHTLARLCANTYDGRRFPEDLSSLLQVNRENSKSQAARLKIIKTHFSGRDSNMQHFMDIDLSVRPHAIAWMTRDDHLCQFLRAEPSLVEKFEDQVNKDR